MVWYFIGVYIISRTLRGRLEIRNFSSPVEHISLVRCAHSKNIFQHSKRNFVSPRAHVISSIYVLLNSCNPATMLLTFIHMNSNGIITWLNCSISFLFENGRFFWNHLVPQLYLNIKHLRASCLEYLLNLSNYNHLLALIFTKQMKDDKKTQWSVNKSNKKCPSEHIHIWTLFKCQRVLTIQLHSNCDTSAY